MYMKIALAYCAVLTVASCAIGHHPHLDYDYEAKKSQIGNFDLQLTWTKPDLGESAGTVTFSNISNSFVQMDMETFTLGWNGQIIPGNEYETNPNVTKTLATTIVNEHGVSVYNPYLIEAGGKWGGAERFSVSSQVSNAITTSRPKQIALQPGESISFRVTDFPNSIFDREIREGVLLALYPRMSLTYANAPAKEKKGVENRLISEGVEKIKTSHKKVLNGVLDIKIRYQSEKNGSRWASQSFSVSKVQVIQYRWLDSPEIEVTIVPNVNEKAIGKKAGMTLRRYFN